MGLRDVDFGSYMVDLSLGSLVIFLLYTFTVMFLQGPLKNLLFFATVTVWFLFRHDLGLLWDMCQLQRMANS